MKRSLIVLAATAVLALTGCGAYEVPQYKEILPSQSAYVIPLEGANKSNQAKFDSVSFLEEKKVAAKRIYIPQRKLSTGRMWFDYKYIPTVRVITVDRAPTTLVWTDRSGIPVESRDSIGFTVGINTSAYIKEEDTSTFLYYYPARDLSSVLGDIIKSKSTEILSREFAKYDLEGSPDKPGARQRKGEIVEIVQRELVAFFKAKGVTISTFGLIGGLAYDDKDIQDSINDNFKSELEIQNKENERLAQEKVNQREIAQATADKKAAQEFAKAAKARTAQIQLEVELMNAKAKLQWAEKWDGKLPPNMMPDNSSMLMQFSK